MKKTFLLLVTAGVMLTMWSFVFAQPVPCDEEPLSKENVQKMEAKREQMHQKHMGKLVKELGLTLEQKEKISKLMNDSWLRVKEEMKKMRELEKSIREETDTQIQQILTPDQVKKFKQLKDKMKEKIDKKLGKSHKPE